MSAAILCLTDCVCDVVNKAGLCGVWLTCALHNEPSHLCPSLVKSEVPWEAQIQSKEVLLWQESNNPTKLARGNIYTLTMFCYQVIQHHLILRIIT